MSNFDERIVCKKEGDTAVSRVALGIIEFCLAD
jgi:hypothetical protein